MNIQIHVFCVPCREESPYFAYSPSKNEYLRYIYSPLFCESIFGFNGENGWYPSLEKVKNAIDTKVSSKSVGFIQDNYFVKTEPYVYSNSEIYHLITLAVIKRKSELLNNPHAYFKMSPSDKRESRKFLFEKIKKGLITPIDIQAYINSKILC